LTSHVYILRDAQHPRFKIGKANDILSRARSFGWQTIDFSNSLGLSVASVSDAYTLEKILQRTFHLSHVDPEEVIASGGCTDGASEWFNLSCWPRLLRYLEDNRDLYPHEIVCGKTLAALVRKLLEPTEGALAREQLKKETQARQAERHEKQVAFRREQMTKLEQDLCLIQPKIRDEIEHHRLQRNVVGVCHGRSGASLVLASKEPMQSGALLWRLNHHDTQYSNYYGSGAVISSFRQMTYLGGTICAISLPQLESQEDSLLGRDHIIYKVFRDEFTWLRQLQDIPEAWLDSTFTRGLLAASDIDEEKSIQAADSLMGAHRRDEIPGWLS